MIRTNDTHLARALEARRRAGHRDLIQWWATADRRQRVVLARYYQPVWLCWEVAMRPAECGVGHISRPEDVRAGEVPDCRVECVLDGESIRLRVQSGPAGWVYTARCERSPRGYAEAWQGAAYALRFWWANGRDIWIERETWERVAWRLRGLEEVLA